MLRQVGLRARYIVSAIAAMLVVALLLERASTRRIDDVLISELERDLVARLDLLEPFVLASGGEGARGPGEWAEEAERLGALASARVTLVGPRGEALGDSATPAARLAELGQLKLREEIAGALRHGQASVLWPAEPGRTRMLYLARRAPDPGRGVAVVRLGIPPTAADAAIGASRRYFVVGTVLAVLFAIGLSALAAFLLTRPVKNLTGLALAMSDGDLEIRAPTRGPEEVAKLGRALNRLASALSRSIRELRTERDRLAGILDGMNEGVLVLDRDGRIVLANHALRGMTSIVDEPSGRTVLEAIRSAPLQEAIDAAGRTDEPVVREIELGSLLPRRLLVHASKLLSAEEERGVIAVFHDVTDLRRLETIRTDFVANVSHELRTPVTAIATAAETLQLGALDDPESAAEFVGVIERNARRLRQLVDDLLDLAKMEAKSAGIVDEDIDVRPVLDHVVELLAQTAKRRGAVVRLDAPADLPRAHADPRALEQILQNLLDNAIKYAGEGARIELSARGEQGGVALVVSDDGAGIAAAHLERIFERFYRVDAGRSRELGGTGLGLAIVKHLVELMQGTIEVESELGRGARFTVRLPGSRPES